MLHLRSRLLVQTRRGSLNFLANDGIENRSHEQYFYLDPSTWSKAQVKEWLEWAISEHNLKDVEVKKFASTDGYKLCQMTMRDMCRLTSKASADALIANLTHLKQRKWV